MGKFVDLSGTTFGRLFVIRRETNLKPGVTRWLCRCDCGNEVVTDGYRLKNGTCKSCGCLHKEAAAHQGHLTRTHGAVKTRLYRVWGNMKTRCNNANNKNFKFWGKRGIEVCEDWSESFESFQAWAKQNGYEDGLSLDRIDNSKGYCPENCRWVSAKEQARNTRKNRLLTYKGETHCLSEWVDILGIHSNTLRNRLKKYSVEEAFEMKVQARKNKHSLSGKMGEGYDGWKPSH